MSKRLAGKVAFVTGAGRGQGRSHAVRLAQEGADIIAVDICGQMDSVPYSLATDEDLRETAAAVEALDRRIVATKADVRDFAGLKKALDDGVAELGRLDIVSANAGIFSVGAAHELSATSWNEMIDVNLNGVWRTAKAAVPHMQRGGSIVLTSSGNGAAPAPLFAHYVAAKYGVVGLMKSLALELASRGIRVNALMPGAVDTNMIKDFRDMTLSSIRYAPSEPPNEHMKLLQPVEISNALVFLASDDARYVTGAAFPVMGMALIEDEPQ